MARKSKNSFADNIIMFLIFVLLSLAIISLIAPIYFILCFFYYKYKSNKNYSSLNGNYSDFWISEAEKKEFTESTITKNEFHQKVLEAIEIGGEKDISINKDGRFSRRSRLGKQLRKIIEDGENKIRIYGRLAYELSFLPLDGWKDFEFTKKKLKANIYAFFFWFLGISGAIQYLITEKIILLNGDYFDIDLWVTFFSTNENSIYIIYFALLFALLISGIGYFLGLRCGVKDARNLSPEPPMVTMENVLLY